MFDLPPPRHISTLPDSTKLKVSTKSQVIPQRPTFERILSSAASGQQPSIEVRTADCAVDGFIHFTDSFRFDVCRLSDRPPFSIPADHFEFESKNWSVGKHGERQLSIMQARMRRSEASSVTRSRRRI